MKLQQANFDKPLPGIIAGRRLQHTVRHDDKGVRRLELVDKYWVIVETDDETRMIPMHRVASLQPFQEQHDAAPAKRRGRPPGSKNRKPDADRPPTETSLPSD